MIITFSTPKNNIIETFCVIISDDDNGLICTKIFDENHENLNKLYNKQIPLLPLKKRKILLIEQLAHAFISATHVTKKNNFYCVDI